MFVPRSTRDPFCCLDKSGETRENTVYKVCAVCNCDVMDYCMQGCGVTPGLLSLSAFKLARSTQVTHCFTFANVSLRGSSRPQPAADGLLKAGMDLVVRTRGATVRPS